MDKAIENMEFEVFFQPKFKFEDESVIGAEALIRWNNPRKGFLQPAKFVPLFEDNGFIEKIDKYVLKKVCMFLDDWNKSPESKNHAPLTISFNLSRCHLYNTNLIKELKDIASQYEIGDNKIEVELTESVMFDNQQRLIKMMGEIKKAGFGVSVDDFGAGYSSLNLLKNMPADVIKLDKEFLSGGPENIKENVIITSVIEMAKKLNITTVAEGVETKTQCDLLKNIGCDIAQGFYYAKPMPQSNFRELLVNSTLTKQNKKSLT
jgi:EAL domain-containing protein (putative c-di-GMP-specific phosphodiesterase class I)